MKKYLALTLFVLLIACQATDKEGTAVSIGQPFLSGSQGLDISFQELRDQVFDGGSLMVVLTLLISLFV